ncbi:SirB1 family protein [Tuwongella immobilis]|uniref:Protein SirB1 N-terminal domain-containing protein n=1 Tax=Tuwongella immobilis TaxID=692036 RepID=A0A6C2YNJ8_9BACT
MTFEQALVILSQAPQASLDLEWLALLLAQDESPELDVSVYLSKLDDLAEQCGDQLLGEWPNRVQQFADWLFHPNRFRGNQHDYYDPRNSFLSDVIDRQLGIPITLSILAIAVGQRLGLTLHGVGLPGHFVVCAREAGYAPILFDPFHGGKLLNRSDCELLIQSSTGLQVPVTDDTLAPLSKPLIVLRMLANLKAIYLQRGDLNRARRVIARMQTLMPRDPIHRRDLGVVCLQLGQAGRAIDELTAYVEMSPYAADRSMVESAIAQAKAEVAKWN